VTKTNELQQLLCIKSQAKDAATKCSRSYMGPQMQ